jgi:FtsZ-binding cell division protein ZapB
MSSEIEYLMRTVEELDEKIFRLMNQVELLKMRIENLEKKADEDESPAS